jgi:glutamate decarboxylase
VQQDSRETAMWLAESVGKLDPFETVSQGDQLPVFAFKLRDGVSGFSVYDVSKALREHGWLVPAYRMPPALDDMHVLRVVVRNGFSRDLAELLLEDLERVASGLASHGGTLGDATPQAFHH